LLAAVPASRAKEMLFTGRRFRVAEAVSMGLVNEVVPESELEGRTLARRSPPCALTVRASARDRQLVRHPGRRIWPRSMRR
jgi:enoyl-CoA hydratase/carnithine racemase